MTRFGEKVRDQRERLQITQEQLAALIGVSRRTIITYETGAAKPHQNTLRKLAEAFGVTQRYLSHDDVNEPQAGIEEEPFIQATRDSFGKIVADEIADLLLKNESIFAGDYLSQEQKDMFYEAISKAYFLNKQHAREKARRKSK